MRLAGRFCLSFIVNSKTQAVCVTRAAVCWCSGDSSFHNTSFPNFILSGWVFASVCHLLFLLWFNLSLPSWKLFAGGLKLPVCTKFHFQISPLWSWLAVSVCHVLFLYNSKCLCHSGNCVLVLESYQFTHNVNFKSQFMRLACCFCLPFIVFLYDSKRLCHSGSSLLVLKSYHFFTQKPIYKCHLSC